MERKFVASTNNIIRITNQNFVSTFRMIAVSERLQMHIIRNDCIFKFFKSQILKINIHQKIK